MLFTEAKLFRRQNVILMNKIVQSVGCSPSYKFAKDRWVDENWVLMVVVFWV